MRGFFILGLAFFSAGTVLFGFVHALFRAFADVVVLGVLRLLLVKRRSGFVCDAVFSWTAFTHRNSLLIGHSSHGFDKSKCNRLSPHRLQARSS